MHGHRLRHELLRYAGHRLVRDRRRRCSSCGASFPTSASRERSTSAIRSRRSSRPPSYRDRQRRAADAVLLIRRRRCRRLARCRHRFALATPIRADRYGRRALGGGGAVHPEQLAGKSLRSRRATRWVSTGYAAGRRHRRELLSWSAHDDRHRHVRAVHDSGESARDESEGGISDHDGFLRVPDADCKPAVSFASGLLDAGRVGPDARRDTGRARLRPISYIACRSLRSAGWSSSSCCTRRLRCFARLRGTAPRPEENPSPCPSSRPLDRASRRATSSYSAIVDEAAADHRADDLIFFDPRMKDRRACASRRAPFLLSWRMSCAGRRLRRRWLGRRGSARTTCSCATASSIRSALPGNRAVGRAHDAAFDVVARIGGRHIVGCQDQRSPRVRWSSRPSRATREFRRKSLH